MIGIDTTNKVSRSGSDELSRSEAAKKVLDGGRLSSVNAHQSTKTAEISKLARSQIQTVVDPKESRNIVNLAFKSASTIANFLNHMKQLSFKAIGSNDRKEIVNLNSEFQKKKISIDQVSRYDQNIRFNPINGKPIRITFPDKSVVDIKNYNLTIDGLNLSESNLISKENIRNALEDIKLRALPSTYESIAYFEELQLRYNSGEGLSNTNKGIDRIINRFN